MSLDNLITFTSGLAYGLSSTLVGHPFDTIKTRAQALSTTPSVTTPSVTNSRSLKILKDLLVSEGIIGLYRGAVPLFFAGGVIRSSQFGFYDVALRYQRKSDPDCDRVLGVVDKQVVIAGFVGGLGRGIIETPADYIKTRRQVDRPWATGGMLKGMLEGASVTFLRNSFLFAAFAVYSDLSTVLVDGGLSPFWKGAVCANMAWLTVWPVSAERTRARTRARARTRTRTRIRRTFFLLCTNPDSIEHAHAHTQTQTHTLFLSLSLCLLSSMS
jgi:hypothetical protein